MWLAWIIIGHQPLEMSEDFGDEVDGTGSISLIVLL